MIANVTKKKMDEKEVETAEDMMIAFEMLDKFRRDKEFLAKDVAKVKKQGQLVLGDEPEPAATFKKSSQAVDPTLTQEERHRLIKERREKRKEEQAKREKEQEEKKKRETEEKR